MSAISLVLGVVMRPKVRDTSEPATLKDLDAPTASENRPIPVVWGTVKLTGPNVTWYGDLQSVKLMNKKAKATLGYRYCIGMELGLCHGPVDAILEIGFADKSAWTGNIAGNSVTGETFTVDNRTLFGGDSDEQLQNGGYGGVYAACTFYRGISNQESNAYLSGVLTTDNPGHSNIAYLVWNGPSYGNLVYNYDLTNPAIGFYREPFLGGYIGTNPRVDDIWFVLRRLPNFINTNYYNINDGDANPIDVIYELLTNSKFGLGLPSTFIDPVSFAYAQKKVYEEGLGLSDIWDAEKKVSEVLDEILQYIDAVIYTDLATGLLTVKLARNDYDLTNLPIFDESTIVEISSYSSPSIDETTNQVQLSYIDRFDKFKSKITVAHDLANARSQGETVSASISYIGICNGTTANKVAFRDLRVLAYPLDKITFTTNRKGTILRPSDVFIVNWPEYGFSNKVFRAIRASYGELVNGICEIDAIEDVFSIGTAVYGSNDDSGWVDPVGSPVTPTIVYATESPNIMSSGKHQLLVSAAKPNTSQMSFNTYACIGTPTGTYAQISGGDTYTPTGLLSIGCSAITDDVLASGLTVAPTNPDALIFLQNFPPEYVKTNNNLTLVTDGVKEEFIAFESVTKSGNNYVLGNVWRGLLDTVPQSWASGTRVWFIDYGVSESDQDFDGSSTVYVKAQSTALKGQSDLSTPSGIVLRRRALKPYPPGHFRINGSTSTVNIAAASDIVVAWEHRNRSTETLTKQFESGISPEAGTEYYLKFFNASNALMRTVGPLSQSTLTYTYTNVDQLADNNTNEPKVVTVQLFSKREGLFSAYCQQRTLIRPTGTPSGTPSYSPGTDTYTPTPAGSASSLNGIPILGAPTNNQVLVYDSGSNTWVPSAPVSSLAGDVTGNISSTVVEKLRSRSLSAAVPTDGQVLAWSESTSSWVPSTPSVTASLGGDVTGAYGSNTVTKIQNKSVASTAPSDGQALIWSSADSAWKPSTVTASSSPSTPILTYYSDVAQSITANSTWTTLTSMELAGSTSYLANWALTFTCVIGGTSADNEKLEFRFVLDDTTFSESWFRSKDAANTTSERHLITIHTVFENVSPSTQHSFKVQWRDYSASAVDVTVLNRRITALAGTASFDPNFTPSSIAGLLYWFKTNSLGLTNGSTVPQLTDYSGNNRHFVAKTSGTVGTYSTNQINGLPAIKFIHDGSGSTATNTQYNGPSFLTSSQGEIFMVIKSPADPSTNNLKNTYGYFGPDDGSSSHYPFTGAGDVYEAFGTSSRKLIPTANTPSSLTNWSLYNVSSRANEWIARLNGSSIFSTTSNSVSWRSAPILGGTGGIAYGAGFDGYIAEIILYNTVLSEPDRLKVRTYIANKYGI